jgi:hypothetical protein
MGTAERREAVGYLKSRIGVIYEGDLGVKTQLYPDAVCAGVFGREVLGQ